jgi:thymidylate synthase
MHPEQQYLDLLEKIMNEGYEKELFMTPEVKLQYEKEGKSYPSIKSVFGAMMKFDLKQ